MPASLVIAHAGSLTAMLHDSLLPSFTASFGDAAPCTVTRIAGPAVGLANRIRSGELAPDLYLSADVATNRLLMGGENGDCVRWFCGFARTRMVLAYSPRSRFAAEFAACGEDTASPRWCKVLQSPGLVFRRSDPRVDPGGYRTLFVLALAEQHYNLPGLKQRILHGDENEAQFYVGRPDFGGGALDAALVYVTAAIGYSAPFLRLPDAIDLGDPAFADVYATVSYTNPQGQHFTGAPATYSVTIPQAAANVEGAAAFVRHLFGAEGYAALLHHGFLPIAPQIGGDPAAVPPALQPLLSGGAAA